MMYLKKTFSSVVRTGEASSCEGWNVFRNLEEVQLSLTEALNTSGFRVLDSLSPWSPPCVLTGRLRATLMKAGGWR